MGWLFGKKKSRIPFPEGMPIPEGALRFPQPTRTERIIEPDRVKAAAGLNDDFSIPTAAEMGFGNPAPNSSSDFDKSNFDKSKESSRSKELFRPFFKSKSPVQSSFSTAPVESESPVVEGPLFLKVNVYQRLLGEIESLRTDFTTLHSVSAALQSSEYNEEDNFTKLRRSVRAVHDRLLQIDKTMFKM